MEQNILTEYNPKLVILPEANNWLRFANLLVDYYLMLYPALYIIAKAIRFFASIYNIDTVALFHSDNIESKLISYTYIYTLCVLIFASVEGLSKGKTLGKLITGTKAVKLDGTPITWKDAFIRSICRMIPFEAFSAFSDKGLWHDRVSKTKVIVVR